jgi:malate synthase
MFRLRLRPKDGLRYITPKRWYVFSAIHGTTSNEVYMEKSIVKDGIDTPNSEITSDETSNEIDSRMQSAVAYVNRFIDELHVSMFLNVLNKNHFRSRNV